MKHVSLYRKWRPRSFGQIVGQEPIVRTVSRAVETGRVAHAYLFSGPRGTGKTSTAKVLAMGLNCAEGPTPEPCGRCESCRAITNNSSMDVLEMDAASNRGIDEIRELRDRVNLAPSSGRMKVYIIDEVHMLTTEAFNALLKMLEEPPEHVVFVLATTEKHKVLPTIVSRCQSFDFRRPGVDVLVEKLSEIAAAEGIEAEPEALAVIAREGQGSFRDAEGLLDQLAAFSDGPVTAQMVRDLLGSVSADVLLQTTAALHERRAADALRIVNRLSGEGKDLGQFVGELLAHLRRLMLLPHAPEAALAEVAGEEREALEAQSEEVPTAEVVRLVEALGESLGRAKRGGDPKLELELTFLKLARDYTEPSVENLIRRIEELESSVANGAAPPRPAQISPAKEAPLPEAGSQGEADDVEAGVVPEPTPKEAEETEDGSPEAGEPSAEPVEEPPEPEPRGDEEPAGGAVDGGDLASQWGSITGELKKRRQALTAAVYEEARVEGFDGSVLRLAFPEEQGFYVGMANERKHADELKKVLEGRVGTRPRIEVRVDGGAAGGTASPPPEPRDEPPLGEPPDEEPSGELPPPEDSPPGEPPDEEPSPAARGPQASVSGNGAVGPGDPAAPSALGPDPLPAAAGDGGGDGIIRDPWEVVEMARERFGRNEDGGA